MPLIETPLSCFNRVENHVSLGGSVLFKKKKSGSSLSKPHLNNNNKQRTFLKTLEEEILMLTMLEKLEKKILKSLDSAT